MKYQPNSNTKPSAQEPARTTSKP